METKWKHTSCSGWEHFSYKTEALRFFVLKGERDRRELDGVLKAQGFREWNEDFLVDFWEKQKQALFAMSITEKGHHALINGYHVFRMFEENLISLSL